MAVFFRDNVNRRDRALQLQSDVVFLQNSATRAKEDLDKQDKRIVPYINQILKDNDISNLDDLQEKLANVLTPEQQKFYSDLVKNSADAQSNDKIAITVVGVIALTSGVAAGSIAIGNLLRVGALMDVLRGFARAFVTLVTEGIDAGIRALRLVTIAARWAQEGTDVTTEAIQIARYTSNAAQYLGFLSIAGILAEGFIMAFAYYEEKEQKEELDKAIKTLYINRIVAKVFSMMCDVIKTQDGIMLSYLLLVGDDPAQAATLATTLVNNVKTSWSNITTKSALDALIVMDSQRKSWTASDPSYDDAIAGADDQLKADPPHAGPTAAKLTSAQSVKAAAYEVAKAADDFWPTSVNHLTAALAHLHDRRAAKVAADLEMVLASTLRIL